jgi:hypothetical protein
MRRYPWQAFASHTIGRVSIDNRARWQEIGQQERSALQRAIANCHCENCKQIAANHLAALTLPGMTL